ncbi:NACHT, LRR and PYD domains-containing protein 3-like isoform X2 [Lissotriton helveticus]
MDENVTEETARTLLLRILDELVEDEFNRFKFHLKDHPLEDELCAIPRPELHNADRVKTADLIISYRGAPRALEVTADLLQKIPRMDLLDQFMLSSDKYLKRKRKCSEASIKGQAMTYKEYVQKKFRLMKDFNSRIGEQVLLSQRYTRLIILKNYRLEEERRHEIIACGERHLMLMRERAEHSFSSINALFYPDEYGCVPSTVVLLGVAGIGKTMTARKIMVDWASGELFSDSFEYAFYINCREHDQLKRQQTIEDLILCSCGGMQLLPMGEIEAKPNKVLFVIDGFDELKIRGFSDLDDPDKKFVEYKPLISLIRKKCLQESHILITTRSVAVNTLTQCLDGYVEDERFAEILGFSEDDRKEYITKFFGNETEGALAFDIVKANQILFTMCFVPIICWLVCNTIKQQLVTKDNSLFSLRTTTSVYLLFLSNLINFHNNQSAHRIIKINLKRLCALAKEGICQQNILFEDEHVNKLGLDVPAVQSLFLNNSVFQKDDENYSMYSFIHLSVQEFFAALFFVLEGSEITTEKEENLQQEVRDILKSYSRRAHNHLMLTVRFLFGLLNNETLAKMQKRLKWNISTVVKPVLLEWVREQFKRIPEDSVSVQLMDVLHCLYEIQDEGFVRSATEQVNEFDLSFAKHLGESNDLEVRAVTFCLKYSPTVQRIVFFNFSMRPEDLQALAPELMKCSALKLGLCGLTASCFAALGPVLRRNLSLQELDLSLNQLEDLGVRELCENLRHPCCGIQTLSLEFCGLTGSGCTDLASILGRIPLGELTLSANELGDTGVRELCKGMKHPGCKLHTLRISTCKLTELCCTDLSSLLGTNSSLTVLELSNNNLGDSGVRELCVGLKHPTCKIHTLEMMSCSLTGSCFADLTSALGSLTTFKELNLNKNDLRDAGVKELCEGLMKAECRLQTLRPYNSKQIKHVFPPIRR